MAWRNDESGAEDKFGETEARDLLLHSLFESLREICWTETPLPTREGSAK